MSHTAICKTKAIHANDLNEYEDTRDEQGKKISMGSNARETTKVKSALTEKQSKSYNSQVEV